MTLERLIGKYGISYDLSRGSVNNGWVPILDDLFQKMIDAGWDRNLAQVKEKFGGLRVYIQGGSNTLWDMIREAESASCSVCEYCGKPGSIRESGTYWLQCLCEQCREIKYKKMLSYDK